MQEQTSLLRAQLGGILWEVSMEDKGANYTGARSSLLEAQKHFIPLKGKGSRRIKRPPWLNSVLLSLLKTRERHTRDGKVDEYLVRATRTLPGHAEMQLEMEKLSSN